MTPKTLTLIVVAATCGLIGSSMTTGLFAERRPHDSEKAAVLAARTPIDRGVTIEIPQDMFEEKLFIRGEEPPGTLTKFDALRGRVVKRTSKKKSPRCWGFP
jgi:flagella basal body P-ring formation protein FlgA